MTRIYKTVEYNPIAKYKKKGEGAKIAADMQTIIAQQAKDGWIYQGYEEVTADVASGCLGVFLNFKGLAHFGVMVFYRES